jgi:hypothetical protein
VKTAKTAAKSASKTVARTASKPAAAKRPAAKAASRAPAAPAAPEGLLPNMTRDALGEVTETLEFMWSATQAVFGDQAKPEHAIAQLPFAMDALEVRRLLEDAAKQGKRKA